MAEYDRAGFPSTIWSRLVVASQQRCEAEEYLVRHYWKPIFHFIQRWNLREEGADLTQEFLARCLEERFLDGVEVRERRGSFRCYLKNALRYFLQNRREWQQAAKRAGDFSHLPFAEELCGREDGRSPEEAFDYIWAREFMVRCYRLLEKRLCARDKALQWQLFREFHLGEERIGYRELMAKYGVPQDDVKNALARGRALLQEIVEAQLRDSVADDEELREEMRELKRILAQRRG